MPRTTQTQGEILAVFNSLVPQAQSLGIRARTRTEWRGGRAAIQARLDELRNQIAQYQVPVTFTGGARTFGCEFEFMLPRGFSRYAIAQALTEAGIDTREESYNHQSRTWWKIVTDNSLGYTRGAELVSPILSGEEGIIQMQKALRVLIAKRCKITDKCGFHVHVGIAGDQISFFKNLARMQRKFDAAIDSVVAPSRRNNHWCRSLSFQENRLDAAQSVSETVDVFGTAKQFAKINFYTVKRQGTVEFRQHQGTINPLKAMMWVRFVMKMCEAASKKTSLELLSPVASLTELLKLIEADDQEKAYFFSRQTEFNSQAAA